MPSLLVHLFLPHESNNHRPKALHLDWLLIYFLTFAVFRMGIVTIHRAYPDVLGYATDIHVEQLLQLTNEKRQGQGLTPLTLNAQLSTAAAQKASDMFASNYWAHNSPTGKTPWDFILSSGYRYTVAGENLAKNFSSSGGVVDAWMASPSHRDNILKSSYKDVGFAVVNGTLNGEETTLVVQMFGASVANAPKPVSALPLPKPVEVSEQASQTNEAPITLVPQASQPATVPTSTVASAYEAVTKTPLINIPTISRELSLVFLGVIMGILTIDAFIISRRRIIRFTGHNVAHIVFFMAIAASSMLIQRGSLL